MLTHCTETPQAHDAPMVQHVSFATVFGRYIRRERKRKGWRRANPAQLVVAERILRALFQP